MELRDRLCMVLKDFSELNLTLGMISNDLNHSSAYLNGICNGSNQKPDEPFYDYFRIRFNVNPFWLHNGKGEMYLEGGKQNNTKQAVLFSKILKLQPKHREAILLIVDSILASREDSV